MLVDENHQMLWLNQAAAESLGVDRQTAITAPCYRLVHGADQPPPDCPLRKMMAEGRAAESEMYQEQSGRWVQVGVYPSGQVTEDGRPVFLHTASDITERKRADQALRESEERHRSIFETAGSVILCVDAEGAITDCNTRVHPVLGYEKEALTGQPITRIIHPDDLDKAFDCLREVLTCGSAHDKEYRMVREDGGVIQVSINSSGLKDEAGEYVRTVCVIEDITERQQAEDKLQRRERHFRSLIENSSDVFMVVKPDGTLDYINPSYERAMGYGTQERVGGSMFENIHPDDITDVARVWERLLGEPGSSSVMQIRARHKDGSWRHMEGAGKNLIDDPAVEGVVVTLRDITERKQAEERLSQREHFFRSLTENASEAFAVMKADGTLDYASPSYERVLGYRAQERAGGDMFESVHPHDVTDAATVWARVLETPGSTGAMQIRVRHKDGAWLHVEATAKNLLDDPVVGGVIATFRDITERQQAEDKHRTIVETAIDGFWITDLDGRLLEVNDSYCEMVGHTREELLTMSIPDLEVIESPQETAQHIANIVARGHDRFVTQQKCKDGRILDVEVSVNSLDEAGGQMFVFLRDITERKQTEDLYRTLTDSSPIGVYIVQDGEFAFVNPRFLEDTGYREEELLDTDPLDIVHPDDRAYVRKNAVAMLKGSRQSPYEFRAFGKGVRMEWAMETVRSIVYRGKRAVLGSFMVVSEQHRVREQLEQKTSELEEASQAKSEFLASMSHELRTPLNAVIGFSELLIDGIPGEVNEEQKECLEDILTSGRHLLTLIGGVLDLSKVEAGKMSLKPESLDLAEVIREAVQTVKPMIDEGGHEVVLGIPEDLPKVRADAGKLRQVLLNFLSNAAKFTPAGGRITVEAAAEDGHCQVAVIDNGIGIREEDQERVFDVFVQAEALPDSTRKGTGLGLSLARQFVELMGGRVSLASEYGKGSRFSFTIPQASDGGLQPVVAEEAEQRPSLVAVPSTSSHQKEVLVVDDDRKARGILRAWLEQDGYTVYEATDADGAIVGASRVRPAVVVLDIMMPGKDGWQALKELKSIPETRDIPVVITSMLTEKELGFSLGAADYFVKPVDKERFLKKVAELGATMATRILVVDDNPADAHLVASFLESDRIGAFCAYCGADGVRMATEAEPDLVVLDLVMPDMNGFEVVDKLRQQESTRDTPIVILTAKDLSDEEFDALRLSTAAVLRKPVFTRESFLSDVRMALGMDEQRQSSARG